MASRAFGSCPPASRGSRTWAAPTAMTASRLPRRIFRSEGMDLSRSEGASRHGVGTRGLRQNDIERWHVVVPLDQGRLWPEVLKRAGIERPHQLGNPAPVGVDENLAAAVLWLRREA